MDSSEPITRMGIAKAHKRDAQIIEVNRAFIMLMENLIGKAECEIDVVVSKKYPDIHATRDKRPAKIIRAATLAAFLRDETFVLEGCQGERTLARALYDRFEDWWMRRNPDCDQPPTRCTLGKCFGLGLFEKRRIGGQLWFYNLKMKGPES